MVLGLREVRCVRLASFRESFDRGFRFPSLRVPCRSCPCCNQAHCNKGLRCSSALRCNRGFCCNRARRLSTEHIYYPPLHPRDMVRFSTVLLPRLARSLPMRCSKSFLFLLVLPRNFSKGRLPLDFHSSNLPTGRLPLRFLVLRPPTRNHIHMFRFLPSMALGPLLPKAGSRSQPPFHFAYVPPPMATTPLAPQVDLPGM